MISTVFAQALVILALVYGRRRRSQRVVTVLLLAALIVAQPARHAISAIVDSPAAALEATAENVWLAWSILFGWAILLACGRRCLADAYAPPLAAAAILTVQQSLYQAAAPVLQAGAAAGGSATMLAGVAFAVATPIGIAVGVVAITMEGRTAPTVAAALAWSTASWLVLLTTVLVALQRPDAPLASSLWAQAALLLTTLASALLTLHAAALKDTDKRRKALAAALLMPGAAFLHLSWILEPMG